MLKVGRARFLALFAALVGFAALSASAAARPAQPPTCPNPLNLACSPPPPVATPPSGPFSQPQSFPPLYELDFPGSFRPTAQYSSTVLTGQDGGQVLTVENPWLTFHFTVRPDGLPPKSNEPVDTWSYDVKLEASLSGAEAQARPGAQDTGQDCSSLHASITPAGPVDWYTVTQTGASTLEPASAPSPISWTPALQIQLQAPATVIRFHGDARGAPVAWAPTIAADSPPLHVVVLPAALIQEKVLPSTILYNPPGANSQASLTLASSYSTVTTAGKTSELDKSNTNDEWIKEEVDIGSSATSKAPLVSDLFDAPFKLSEDSKWDNSVSLFNGQATLDQTAYSQMCSVSFTDGIGNTGRQTIPGASGPYAFEPFWDDHIEVLVHPQFALWDFYGTMTMQLLGSDGICGVSPLQALDVYDLNLCANPSLPGPNGAANPRATGYPLTLSNGAGGTTTETLNATDCTELAALDPFWSSANGQAAALAGRGTFLRADSYGVPAPGHADITKMISEAWTASVATTHQVTDTYKSTVESVHATEGSAGLSFSDVIGLDASVTLSAGTTTTNDTIQSIVYSNATVQTSSQTTTVTGSLDDQRWRGYEPQVEFYQDDVFSTPMYRDPGARCTPAVTCTTPPGVGPGGPPPPGPKQ
jgi:hypothetical protein